MALKDEGDWVIRDALRGGYAVDNPIEGWIFTTVLVDATRFSDRAYAAAALEEHYKHERTRLEIVRVPREGGGPR